MTYNDKYWSYQISVEIPLAKCIANFLPDDPVLRYFIELLNVKLRVFNKFFRHPLDNRLSDENVCDTYFDWHGRRRKKIEVIIKKLKLGLPPRSFLNLFMSEVVCSGWLNDMLGRSLMSYHMECLFIIFIRCCTQSITLQLLGNWWFYWGSSLIGGLSWQLCFKFVFGACICGIFVVDVSFRVMSLLMIFKLHMLNNILHLLLWFATGRWFWRFGGCLHNQIVVFQRRKFYVTCRFPFHGCRQLAHYAKLVNIPVFFGNLVKLFVVALLPRWVHL